MKKLNGKGFTLIELLAVITIMGILMLTAIPAVSRTIQNSRKDTFSNVAKNYINAVREAVLADNIVCYSVENPIANFSENYKTDESNEKKYSSESDKAINASSFSDGTYYFPICTKSTFCTAIRLDSYGTKKGPNFTKIRIASSTSNLMESQSASPFGGASMKGYVKWVKAGNKTTYSAVLIDSGGNGIKTELTESSITRNAVKTASEKLDSLIPEQVSDEARYPCRMN